MIMQQSVIHHRTRGLTRGVLTTKERTALNSDLRYIGSTFTVSIDLIWYIPDVPHERLRN